MVHLVNVLRIVVCALVSKGILSLRILCKLNLVSFTFFVYSGRCDPLSCDSGVWPLSSSNMNIC